MSRQLWGSNWPHPFSPYPMTKRKKTVWPCKHNSILRHIARIALLDACNSNPLVGVALWKPVNSDLWIFAHYTNKGCSFPCTSMQQSMIMKSGRGLQRTNVVSVCIIALPYRVFQNFPSQVIHPICWIILKRDWPRGKHDLDYPTWFQRVSYRKIWRREWN